MKNTMMTIRKASYLIRLLFVYVCLTSACMLHAQPSEPIEASLNNISLKFQLDKQGTPSYEVMYKNKTIIPFSKMGFVINTKTYLNKDFKIIQTEKTVFDSTWKPVWGEVSSIRDHHTELKVQLQENRTDGLLLNIIFRVFEDGVGFRYEFPQQPNLKYFIVNQELTEFKLSGDHKAFWIPGDYDTNEYAYTTSTISTINNKPIVQQSEDIAVRVAPDNYSVQTPLMMKSADGLYINIHEAALINYPAMQLHVDGKALSLSSNLVPDAIGNMAYLHAPFHTPWRTIIISDKATDILASKMILNLNDNSTIQDVAWIKPMKFVGVWWEMQTGKSTWSYAASPESVDANGKLIPSGMHGANTKNVKRYIDFAAANKIDGVLVEGWNTGWEDWFGNWKDNVFDFVTPYPDFDIKEITAYAALKGVKMIMHNETSGAATNYERRIDTAFRLMNKFGYTSVKTGYVGKIIPRGEHHDGQFMVNHYNYVAEKAAQYHVMLDAHEPVRPTGLQRTYPNWMACEAARGNEYNAFSNGNAPEHETILPFTRLMGGPMDYTPGIFKIKGYSTVAGRQVHTTLAKQLALYITIYSPLQMVADLPENYAAHTDAFQFIKDVPVDWDDTKILEAEPGDYITIARKEKGKDNWFIGSVTDEHARNSQINLDFLTKGKKYKAVIYADAANAHWQTNPEAYTIKELTVDNSSILKLAVAAGGGFAVSIMRLPE